MYEKISSVLNKYLEELPKRGLRSVGNSCK